ARRRRVGGRGAGPALAVAAGACARALRRPGPGADARPCQPRGLVAGARHGDQAALHRARVRPRRRLTRRHPPSDGSPTPAPGSSGCLLANIAMHPAPSTLHTAADALTLRQPSALAGRLLAWHPAMTPDALALWASVYFAIACNLAFWRAVAATGALSGL